MLDTSSSTSDASPFHAGEQALQTRVGRREMMETFGRQAMRPFMPDQHREFFSQLPFLVIGAVDDDGWPWASLLPGKPGFASTPTDTELTLKTQATPGDPIGPAIRQGAPVGLLGIEMHTRRRNRLNGRVSERGYAEFSVRVDQSFGNCPQYIQHRDVQFVREPCQTGTSGKVDRFSQFDARAQNLISQADVFFVSSYVQAHDNPAIEGVDVSHRGGRPGFVKLDGNALTVPDFPGNYLFNTLGNFLLNPKAGLVFVDFTTGDLLTLTGTVELLDETHEDVTVFQGAQRGWRFTLDHGHWLDGALPFRSTLGEFSPNSLLTDTWADAQARQAIEAKRKAWRPYRVARIEDESSVIRSFYLEPEDGEPLFTFDAGQFLRIRVKPDGSEKPVARTYTISSSPTDRHYRLSVKREEQGLVSRHLHDTIKVGDTITAKAPRGDFTLDAAEKRPAVLLAGGVGVTPMISMARHVATEGLRTRHTRPLTVIHAVQTTEQRAFSQDFQELNQVTAKQIRYFSLVDRVLTGETVGETFNDVGYITAGVLKQILPLDDYDFYLCGPGPFMQALYDILRGLGVRDARIYAESFGPASLERAPEVGAVLFEPEEEAEQSIISFAKSRFEQRWNKGDATLLEVAEAHGLTPAFSCRGGTCGSCATKLISGSVAYRTEPTAERAVDEVLICCSVPAKNSDTIELDL